MAATAAIQSSRPAHPRHAVHRAVGVALSFHLLAQPVHAATLSPTEVDAEKSPLIQSLLEKSKQNRERNNAERLDHYNAKNFCDAFAVDARSEKLADSRGLTKETFQAIDAWRKEHKC